MLGVRKQVLSRIIELTKSRVSLLNGSQFVANHEGSFEKSSPLRNDNFHSNSSSSGSSLKYVDPLVNGLISKIGTKNEPQIVIAMSSGVDSSLCAALFKYLGFNKITGVYMQNWGESANNDTQTVSSISYKEEEEEKEEAKKEKKPPAEGPKCWEKDWKDVQKLGEFLKIPVERVDFQKDYWLDVFQPMVDGYKHGDTPNPDLGCNRYIKFGKLVEHLDKKYGDYYLVTGHYSRVLQLLRKHGEGEGEGEGEEHIHGQNLDGNYHLFKSFDTTKDQSYYLSQINGKILNRVIFPLGNLTKREVRVFAKEWDIPTCEKKDSQGICFIENSQSKGNFNSFLSDYIEPCKGNIVSFDESVLPPKKIVWGEHKGLWSYTKGQRIRIPIPQTHEFKGQWFVSDKLKSTNEIVIVQGKDNKKLFSNVILIKDFQPMQESGSSFSPCCNGFINTLMRNGSININIKYRSLHNELIRVKKVSKYAIESSSEEVFLKIELESEHRAITAGQYCCLYDGDRVLGCGTITDS